eukprot:evm.model.scf_54.4 EVM.evm.TU.scf_54.4   scf_54:59274-65880(-)
MAAGPDEQESRDGALFIDPESDAADGEILEGAAGPTSSDSDDDVDVVGNGEGASGEGAAFMEDEEDDSFHCFQGHRGSVFAVAWNPIGNGMVASGGEDDMAFLWKVADGTQVDLENHGLTGHTDSVISLAFNSTGQMAATASMDGSVRTWNTGNGNMIRALEGPTDSVDWVSFHPRGDVVLAGSTDFSVWMWNATSGACMQVFSGHCGPVTCGGFTPDGRAVVSGGGNGDASLRVWDPRTGQCSVTVRGHDYHQGGLTCMEVHSEGAVALTGSEDCSGRIANIQTGRIMGELAGHTDSVETVGFSPVQQVCYTGSLDCKAAAWDMSTMQRRQTFEHPEGVIVLSSIPSSPLFLSGCLDTAVRLWDSRTGRCERLMRGHHEGIQCMAVSPDGRRVLTGSDDHSVRVFDI